MTLPGLRSPIVGSVASGPGDSHQVSDGAEEALLCRLVTGIRHDQDLLRQRFRWHRWPAWSASFPALRPKRWVKRASAGQGWILPSSHGWSER